MKIYRDVSPSSEYCGIKTAITLGTYDGVHIGHQRIIDKVIRKARNAGITSAVVTFDRHPMSLLNPAESPKLLTTLDEKLALLEKTGVDVTFVLSFTREISEITAESFIEQYLINCLGMKYFVVGYDHGFGKNRLSSSSRLREYSGQAGFELEILEPVTIDDTSIKSSVIRDMIAAGDVARANRYLGRQYCVTGTVRHGKGIGSKMGFPTANVYPDDPEKLIPREGVYTGGVLLDGVWHDAATCVCSRTTASETETIIESFLPGYTGDLYGRTVEVSFERKLRDVVQFDSTDELARQIRRDIEQLTKS